MLPANIRIANLPSQQRRTRSPQHRFNLKHRSFQVQPFMIAPVLPGETLTYATLQARGKTDPLAAAVDMFGWWLEHMFFYVKLTDLEGRDDFKEMLISFGHDLSSFDEAADVKTYHAGPGVNWTSLCVDRIVEEYFRDEGDGTVTFDGMHQAMIQGETYLDSAKLDSATVVQDELLPGENPVVPDEYSGAFANHYAQWEHMRALQLTAATFEDWIAAFGIQTDSKPAREDFKPELLRYVREFQYPSVIVDGATSTSTAAVVWNVADKLDKRRLFKEPGFICGVTTARPKVYLGKMKGAGISMMNDAYAWLPAVLRDAPFTSLKKFIVSTPDGPLGATPSEDYWIDIRDLFIYGDQFVNYDISGTPAGFAALPAATMQRKYMAEADINAFFATPASVHHIRQDGIVQLSVLGMQSDQT